MDDKNEPQDASNAPAPDFDHWAPARQRVDPRRVEVFIRMLSVNPALARNYRQLDGE